jgi:hypothetical protein
MSTSRPSSSVASNSPASTLTSPLESDSLFSEVSKASEESLDGDKDSRPTVLNIPQELRDKTFEYVYGNSGTDDGRVDVVVVKTRPPWSRAGLASHHTLPSTLLVCRQLYIEMRGMQRALCRQFWTANTIHLSSSQEFRDLEGQHKRAAFYDGLVRAQHFVIVVEELDHRCGIDIHLAGASTTATARLTSLSVTPHSQVLVEQKYQDLILRYAMRVFYDRDGHRRVLAGRGAYNDPLRMDLIWLSRLTRRIVRWSQRHVT